MELSNPNYVLDLLKYLMMSIVEETKNPTKNLDLNERYYKRNMRQIALIDVSTLYVRLSSIFLEIKELKINVALENNFHKNESDYGNFVGRVCAAVVTSI